MSFEKVELDIIFDAETAGRFPVYCKYAHNCLVQKAYVTLDIRDGECDADYATQHGSTSADMFHSLVLTFNINPETTADKIAALIEEHKEEFQAILDDSEQHWDGSNWIGKFGDNARRIINKLGGTVCGENEDLEPDGLQPFGSESAMIDDDYFCDWVNDALYPQDQTPVDLARELLALDGENDCYFSDSMNSEDAILSSLEECWVRDVQNDDVSKMSVVIAKYVLAECSDELDDEDKALLNDVIAE